MGNMLGAFQKNARELHSAYKTNIGTYTFQQRKGDRLVTLFFISSLVNFWIVFTIVFLELYDRKKIIIYLLKLFQIYGRY
jgi:hypothetical protein